MNDRPEPFRLLFVCTGNTCRSPLAEALAERTAAERGWSHVRVRSAGTSTLPGMPASVGSLRAAERHGLDLSGHRSRTLDAEELAESDLVLCMSRSHLDRVHDLGGEGRSSLLSAFAAGRQDPADGVAIPDPFHGGNEAYQEAFDQIEQFVVAALDRLEPLLDP